jgi:hypothetical protein
MASRSESVFLKNKPKRDFEISSHISLVNHYVFVQVSKAASSSVKWALQSLEFKRTPWKVIDVNNKFYSPHVSPYQVPHDLLDKFFFGDGCKRVTFVRNPFSRLLSCYLHRVVAKPRSATNSALKKITGGRGGADVSFDEFVEIVCAQEALEQEAHWRCQSEDLCFDKISYDFVGKLEFLKNDLVDMLNLLYGEALTAWYFNGRNADASPMKTGSSEKLAEYYKDSVTIKRVMERYESDFISFGYEFKI